MVLILIVTLFILFNCVFSGVIRALYEKGKLSHAFCTETRPYNQGARLTAYELVHEKIPSTLITDSMVSFAMKKKEISGE